MKTRKHHNNKGYRQIKNGTTEKQLKAICKRLGLQYGTAHKKEVKMMDLKHMRKLCGVATQGKWYFTNGKVPRIMTKDQLSIAGIHKRGLNRGTFNEKEFVANGEFIAATDPQTVRALIDEVEKYRADLEGMKEVLNFYKSGDDKKTPSETGRIIGYEECIHTLEQALKGTDDE